MTAIELRTSITEDLNQLSTEMLENVSQYVKRLIKRSRPTKSSVASEHRSIDITPGVARLRMGYPTDISDEELDNMRYEYLKEKYL